MTMNVIPAQFSDPVHDSQQAFRAMLSATSRPGTIVSVPLPPSVPASLSPALCSIALTLFDDTTPVWLEASLATDDVLRYLRLHTSVKIVTEKADCVFAIMTSTDEFSDFKLYPGGDAAYPDRSATLIVQLPSLARGPTVTLYGPGIENTVAVSPAGLPEGFWERWNENTGRYPCGIDMIFTDGAAVMGLPRTTKARF